MNLSVYKVHHVDQDHRSSSTIYKKWKNRYGFFLSIVNVVNGNNIFFSGISRINFEFWYRIFPWFLKKIMSEISKRLDIVIKM